jgi:alpha-D-xyloside xylohydrolase
MSSFEHLHEYMIAGLNLAMSGIPWGASEIGGFVTHDNTSPRFHELMVRWYQYGVFTPVFRTHGNRPNNEAWTIGGDTYPHIRAAMMLRERLRPYVMEQMVVASKRGIPPMRPLFFDFEDDPRAAQVEDQFLFGPDLLIAPITEYRARSREVYLPAECDWTDAWSGMVLPAGGTVTADAPIEHIPVFVRGRNAELLSLFQGLYDL